MDEDETTEVKLYYESDEGDEIEYSVRVPYGQIYRLLELMDDLHQD